MELQACHESILVRLLDALDLRSRIAVLCTCTRMKRLCERPELWRRIAFESADEQRGLKAEWLLGVLARAAGGVEVLQLARSREARDAEGQQRFSDGLKLGQLLPHTQGAGAARLAALVPALVHLSVDERASCLGGMTNCLARALAARCRGLRALEVAFDRYSLPGELFTDDGLIALSEGARGLAALSLVNCDYVSDRALYALAANCRGLRELALGGYNENITDGGLTVLIESCPSLSSLWLGGKLLKVTDTTLAALARHQGRGLRRVKLTRSMGAAGLAALAAARCPLLAEVDARHVAGGVPAPLLAALARACPSLVRVTLPPLPPGEGAEEWAGPGSGSEQACSEDEDEGGDGGEEARGGGGGAAEPGGWRVAGGWGGGGGGCYGGAARGARLLLQEDVRRLQDCAAGQ